jgi:phage recombination protein Bet
MSTEIAKRQTAEIDFTTEQIDVMRKTIAKDATPIEFELFLNIAKSAGLNPFHRQVFFVKRGGIGQTTASIDGLRLIAHRTGQYRGQVGPMWCGPDGEWKDVWTESVPPVAAKVGVWREGFSEPLFAVANFNAYCANTPIWKKMPELMISKCCESLALRRAFPLEMSGLYSTEELDGEDFREQKSVINAEMVSEKPNQTLPETKEQVKRDPYIDCLADKTWLVSQLALRGVVNDKSDEYQNAARAWHTWAIGRDKSEVKAKLDADVGKELAQ